MSAPFPNLYTHRQVAEASAKACDVCYKPSTSVLITTDKKDFFYICPVHLKDRYFCTPKIDEDAIKARREKELAEEKERVVKEYEEKRKKKEKAKEEKEKSKDKDKDEGKDKKKEDKEDKKTEENDESKKQEDSADSKEEEPRIFELKSAFYQQRLQRKRQAEAAKRDRERASQPNYFPSVPNAPPGK